MAKKLCLKEIAKKFNECNWKLLSKEYINSRTSLSVICNQGHETTITWNNFQRGQGCSFCFGNKQLDLSQVKQIFESQGCVLLSELYENNVQLLDYICCCGSISQVRLRDFKQGNKCNICKGTRISNKLLKPLPIEKMKKFCIDNCLEFIDAYRENKKIYLKYNKSGIIYCKKWNKTNVVRSTNPFISCNVFKKSLFTNNADLLLLNTNTNIYLLHKKLKLPKDRRDLSFAFEKWIKNPDQVAGDVICNYIKEDFNHCCPQATLIDVNLATEKSFYYNKFLETKGLFIFPHEWINNKIQIINRYKTIFDNDFIMKIGARKCSIDIANKEHMRYFCDQYHIQKSNNLSVIAFGLFYKNDLLGILSLGRHHRGGNDLVLDRLCFKQGYHISGGTERLLQYAKLWAFENNYKEIISYSDNRYTDGSVYDRNGFKKEKERGPDYLYVLKSDCSIGLSKQSQSKHLVKCPKNRTELEWAEIRGLQRIWDCGKIKWKLDI